MTKIKELERRHRTLDRKNIAIRKLKEKDEPYIGKSFLLMMRTTFVMSLIGAVLESISFDYISEANTVLIGFIVLSILNTVFSIFFSIKIRKKIEYKISIINKKYTIKNKDLMIALEDVDEYIEELETMSDESVDKISPFIINEIIDRKKEKESYDTSRNSNRLKEAFLREKNENVTIVNN